MDISSRIKTQLPHELIDLMQLAGREAAHANRRLYLVGGVVRDLLLNRPTFDVDLAVEGDATALARKVAAAYKAKLTVHAAFNTAKMQWGEWSIDFATARSETYSRPGALPSVKTASIEMDLFRRDFTINAMAVELTGDRWGQLIDLYGGVSDLDNRIIRILHDNSFTDDATRMWRAVRYEQRLGFRLERGTRALLVRDLDMLDTISGDRIRHELELVLKEEFPEKALRRAGELRILQKTHPSLKADAWLARKFRHARRAPGEVALTLQYLGLLVYRLGGDVAQQIADYLKLPRATSQILTDIMALKPRLAELSQPRLKPSDTYRLLEDVSPSAVATCQIASDSPIARRRLALYLSTLRHTKPSLAGNDLITLGLPQGPRVKEVLSALKSAKLDGQVRTRDDEVEMAKRLIWPALNPGAEPAHQ